MLTDSRAPAQNAESTDNAVSHKGSQTALCFKDVSKSFGAFTVLRNFNCSIAAGERVTLVGPSGSGKTTVLRLAMGLENANAGSISLFGREYNSQAILGTRHSRDAAKEIRRAVGMVFQQFNLFPHLRVIENVALALRSNLNLDKATSRQVALEHLDLVGLKEKAEAYPGQLSGGQQQRVALARALALKPAVLLLDEITSALDPELVGEVLEVVRDIAMETNVAMLVVTHEMRFARQISHRVLMFDRGEVVEDSPPDVFFEAPRSERTRDFLGKVENH